MKTHLELHSKPAYPTYDSEFPWYRWKVNLPYSDITNNINSKIAARYKANSKIFRL